MKNYTIYSKNCNANRVSFGKVSCNVLNCTSESITCQTTNANKMYTINNNGYDPCEIYLII